MPAVRRPYRRLHGRSVLVTALVLTALLFAATRVQAAPTHKPTLGCPPPSAAEVEAIGRAYFAAFNTGDVAALDALLAFDYRHQGAVVSPQDRALHLERLRAVRRGFPDGVYTINWLVVEADTVVIRHIFSGTHLGEYTGVAATGRRVAVSAFHVHQIRCGQVSQTWNAGDAIGLFRQLGTIQSPATTDPPGEPVAPPASTRMPCPTTTPAQNAAVARRWYDEALNQNRLAVIDDLLAPNAVHRGAAFVDSVGREAVKGVLAALLTAFPDGRYGVESIVAAGDRVVIRWSLAGTHDGPLFGVPPTGRPVTGYGINAFRFSCGEIVESWSEVNGLEILRQIGALP